jgi:hypothetical protein
MKKKQKQPNPTIRSNSASTPTRSGITWPVNWTGPRRNRCRRWSLMGSCTSWLNSRACPGKAHLLRIGRSEIDCMQGSVTKCRATRGCATRGCATRGGATREHSSGGKRRGGSVNKSGNPRVLAQLVEMVWRMIRWQLFTGQTKAQNLGSIYLPKATCDPTYETKAELRAPE